MSDTKTGTEMEPRIVEFDGKRLVGINAEMSFIQNGTSSLWRAFLPRKSEIQNASGSDLFSLQIFPPDYFSQFDPAKTFIKWAAIEVQSIDPLPEGMSSLEVPAGRYAVFHYKGASSQAPTVFQYIFGAWIPKSNYRLDNRPHFEVLGAKYKQDHPESEEDIWIPIADK